MLGAICGVAVFAAAYAYLALNSDGWESNRLLSIGIGGGIGWFMLLNVWGVIWRMQKKIIRWTRENPAGAMPPELARLARLTFLASRRELRALVPHAVLHGRRQPLPDVWEVSFSFSFSFSSVIAEFDRLILQIVIRLRANACERR